MLNDEYTDIAVLSIAAADNDSLSFSADTGMAECLVVARKLEPDEPLSGRTRFTSLRRRPQGFAHASAVASAVGNCSYVRQIEDGPYGGSPLAVGNEIAGQMLTAPSQSEQEVWGAVRLADYSLAQSAYALSNSRLWLPGSSNGVEVGLVPLSTMAVLGFITSISLDCHVKGRRKAHSARLPRVRLPLTLLSGTTTPRRRLELSAPLTHNCSFGLVWRTKPRLFGQPPVVHTSTSTSDSILSPWEPRSRTARA